MSINNNMRIHPIFDIAGTGGILFAEIMPTYMFVILFIVYRIIFIPKHKKGMMI